MTAWDLLLVVAIGIIAYAAGLVYLPAGIAVAGLGLGAVWNLFPPKADK